MYIRIFNALFPFDRFSLEDVAKLFYAYRGVFVNWAAIVHDKDVYTEKDEEKNPTHKAGELKPKHIHVVGTFYVEEVINHYYLAEMLDIPPQFLYCPRPNRKTDSSMLDAMLRSLINADNTNIFYDSHQVVANFDYIGYIALNNNRRREGGDDL